MSDILLSLLVFISELKDETALLYDSESSYNHVEFLANRIRLQLFTP